MLYDERVIKMETITADNIETIIESKKFTVESRSAELTEANKYFRILYGKQLITVMRNDIRELKNIVDTIEHDFL